MNRVGDYKAGEEGSTVLLVAENGFSGGIGRYCVDVAQALNERSAVVCLCLEPCSGMGTCWLSSQCRERGVRLIPMLMPARDWAGGFRRLSALWRSEGCPIVHVNGRRGNFLALLAKMRLPGFRYVTTVHGVLGLHARRNALYRLVDVGACRWASAVIAVSADTRRKLLAAGVPWKRILTIRNGLAARDLAALVQVAAARATTTTMGTRRVGFLGRLSPEKGIDEFVQVAQRLSAIDPGLRFLVAGDGPASASFLEKSEGLRREGVLVHVGVTDDTADFLSQVDLLVMPSHNEGMPYALLEGMAAGCAVVAYGVGGIPEVIEDGSLGVLTRPLDLDGLTKAVSDLSGSPALAAALGSRASVYVRDHCSLTERLPLLRKAYEMCRSDLSGASRMSQELRRCDSLCGR